ncbi:RsiV family protein [Psychrobacillus antarcticus]|uniref:RsiV family protein n=1 Tax=Psychrobacillus antarcticus TaxID=2879115 RepID=UPI0024077BC5|nr:RsiV family protein [Psychrobacillus antarcticus]
MLGQIIKVVTLQELSEEVGTSKVDLKTPNVTGLTNKGLENSLNEKYVEENKLLYEGFQKEMESGGDRDVSSAYKVVTDTDDILSINRYEVNPGGSSFTTMRTDTIDKKNEILITLPSLFKDNGYINVVSSYIKSEMSKEMEADETITYWIASDEVSGFEAIRPDQTFSITADHKLTISFDKYEVALGSMSVVTFEIQTDVIKDELVSDYYIK